MTIKQYVYNALKDHPDSRSNDDALINYVFKAYASEHSLSILMVNDTIKALGFLPSIRTIIRQRQRLQAKYPELTDPQTVLERAALEEEYREEYLSDLDFSDVDPDSLI